MSRTTSIFRWLAMVISTTVGLLLIGCTPGVQLDLTTAASCTLPSSLQSERKADPDILWHGCLVMFWQSQKKSTSYQQPLHIDGQGSITMLDKAGGNENQLKLPPSSLKHPFITRIYIFSKEKNKELAQDSDGHELLCRKMSAYQYNCFEHLKECRYSFLLKPTLRSGGQTLKSYLPSLDKKSNCRICKAEICDGKDNDCDGQVDERDALKGTPCPSTQP